MEFSMTLIIVAITGLVSYFSFQNRELQSKLLHHPYSVKRNKEFHRWITSGLVHANWMHLLINLIVLYSFGEYVEYMLCSSTYFGPTMGKVALLVFYVLALIASDIPFYTKHQDDPSRASLGASGATSAILFASVFFNPWSNIYLYGVIPIPAIIAAVLFLLYESYYMGKGNTGINHSAHLYGAIFGIIGIMLMNPMEIQSFFSKLIDIPFLN